MVKSMAKKKNRKDDGKQKAPYTVELTGLFLIVLALIGLVTKNSLVGSVIYSFSVFLVGNFGPVLLFLVLLIGVYIIIKREAPNYFHIRFIGFYILMIAVLTFLHQSVVDFTKVQGLELFTVTFNDLVEVFNTRNIVANSFVGGGILGCSFLYIFFTLFQNLGVSIIEVALTIVGLILLFNVSILDVLQAIKGFFMKIFGTIKTAKPKERKEHHEHVEDEKIEDKEDKIEEYIEEPPIPQEEKKIIISSVEELIAHDLRKEEESKQESPSSQIPITGMINEDYKLPPLSLLDNAKKGNTQENQKAIDTTVTILERSLKDFDLEGKVVEVHVGPTVTQYEMEVKAGTKLSRILSIQKELALALAAKDVRIEAPIPGKNTIGIEVPNKVNIMVSVKEIVESMPKSMDNSKLLVVLGRNIMGRPMYMEINKTPHLLVAGTTGSGKSVCVNSIIVSLLMRTRPDEVKLMLVDPKKVELSVYNGAPHLMAPVVTDPKKASIALKNLVVEMEKRYDRFSETGTKNIETYNNYIDKHNQTSAPNEMLPRLPYIVAIIDELADLMLVAAKEVEDSILRITQMARAAGIHLIVATQRPSTDVITGVVKANIPSRIAFAVGSSIDSRTILDMVGAEKLLGKGDMLFKPMGENIPIRIQGTYVSDDEVKRVVDFTVNQQKANYDLSLTMAQDGKDSNPNHSYDDEEEEYDDPLYNEIVEFVITTGKVSASLLQRKYRLGYNRAARIVDLLEERGIIGPANGSKPREVLVKLENKEE